jgi:hypothetical protein
MRINPLISTPSHTTISSSGNQLTRFVGNTANNLAKVAIPLIVTAALASIPSADAGPLAYASCMAGCAAMGPFAPACWSACLIALGLPTP